jgi:biotin carboxylase
LGPAFLLNCQINAIEEEYDPLTPVCLAAYSFEERGLSILMATPTVLFVNLRTTDPERRAAVFAAWQLGYQVVLLADSVPVSANSLFAAVEIVDTYDREQALRAARELARRYQIQGVVTWSDRDVELVAQIGLALGLPAPSPAAAQKARNKYIMKQALAHLPGLVPHHARVCSWPELEQAIQTIGFPAVLKPTGASASKGIFELNHPADLQNAFATLQDFARPAVDPIFRTYGAEFILEEFLSGPEFSVEGWVFQGNVEVVGITDKQTTEPFHLEYQHLYPSALPEAAQQEIRAKTVQIVKTLDLNNCAFHLEGKLTPAGFRLIEIAARIGGDYITSHLIPLSSGLNFYAQVLRVVTGQQPRREDSLHLYAGARFLLAQTEGTLRGLTGLEQVLQRSSVEHCFMESSPGAPILLPPRHFAAQRVGAVVVRDTEYAAVEQTLADICRQCSVSVQ